MPALHTSAISISALIVLMISLVSAHIGSPIIPQSPARAQANNAAAAALPAATPTNTAVATPTRVPAPQVTHNLVLFGDSLTEGSFATSQAQDFAYRTAALTQLPFVVKGEYGVSAVVTAQIMRDSNPKFTVVPRDALYVVIELGTNDVVATGETLAQFESNYDYILTRVHQDAPNAHLICLGVWRNPNADAFQSGYLYNQIIQSDCPGSYVPLGDLYMDTSLRGPAGRLTWLGMSDDFHPNDAGHAAIAARIAAVIG